MEFKTDDAIVQRKYDRAAAEDDAAHALAVRRLSMANPAKLVNLDKQVEALGHQVSALAKRPVKTEVTVKTEEPKTPKTVNKPTFRDAVAVPAAAELIRRSDQTSYAKTLDALYKGARDAFRKRTAARALKAATNPASTTDVSFGADLTQHSILAPLAEKVPNSVAAALPKFGARVINMGLNASVTIPRVHLDRLPASWVSEGASIPVREGAMGSAAMYRYKQAIITVVSKELVKVSTPNIVDLVEETILQDTAKSIDLNMLSDQAAIANLRPSGIMFGVTPTASAGSTVEDILSDGKLLLKAMVDVQAVSPVIIINPLTVAALWMKQSGTSGVFPFREDINKGTLFGLPFIKSTNADAARIIAMDADRFMISAGLPEVDLSEQAALVMVDDDGAAPTMGHAGGHPGVDGSGSIHVSDAAGTTPASEVRSTLQSYALGLRLVQPITYAFERPGVVAAIDGVDY